MELNGKHQLFVYSDDVSILGENLQTFRENTENFMKASKNIGLEENPQKSKLYDHISPPKSNTKSKYSNWKFVV